MQGKIPKNIFDVRIPNSLLVSSKKPKLKKRQLTHAQKIFAWENYSHTCNICGKRVIKFSEAEFDHTRAHSKSGATNLSNVKIVHRACNRLKGKKSLSETKKLLGIKSASKKKSFKKKIVKKKSSSNLQNNFFINPLNGKKEKSSFFGFP